MAVDPSLSDRLRAVRTERVDHHVYRATVVSRDPLVFSGSGGRWAPPVTADDDVSILYTSLDRDGALAEIVSYLIELTPLPSFESLKVSRLWVAPMVTARFSRTDLSGLGVDMARFAQRDYARTQTIGAALAQLGAGGFLAPSARHDGENLMIFRGGTWTHRRYR